MENMSNLVKIQTIVSYIAVMMRMTSSMEAAGLADVLKVNDEELAMLDARRRLDEKCAG